MVFGIFVMLTFSLQDLFANGFWNTYNRTWDSVKALHILKDVSGSDLAAKERAIKDIPAAKNKVAQFHVRHG